MEHSEIMLDDEHILIISRVATAQARDSAPKDIADDIAQDVTLHCLLKLRSGEMIYHEEVTAPLVCQMVRCRIIDELRRRSRRSRNDAEHVNDLVDNAREWMDPEHAFENVELDAMRERAFAFLSPMCRRVFTMVRFDGLGHGVVAKALGISRWTVRRQLMNARRCFRLELKRVGVRVARQSPHDPPKHRRMRSLRRSRRGQSAMRGTPGSTVNASAHAAVASNTVVAATSTTHSPNPDGQRHLHLVSEAQ